MREKRVKPFDAKCLVTQIRHFPLHRFPISPSDGGCNFSRRIFFTLLFQTFCLLLCCVFSLHQGSSITKRTFLITNLKCFYKFMFCKSYSLFKGLNYPEYFLWFSFLKSKPFCLFAFEALFLAHQHELQSHCF